MIKLFAVDIDGVLVKDTFSPVIKLLCDKHEKEYIREVERNVFSRPRNEAATYLIKYLELNKTIQELLDYYFAEREKYIDINGGGLTEGVEEFLQLVKNLGYKMVCYGGLSEDYFKDELGEYATYFDKYICTNDFRPGIKEITKDMYELEYNEVIFIDDVNTVAEKAKELNVPFIGMPSSFEFGFQKSDMKNTDVKYMIHSLKDINESLIQQIELSVEKNLYW